MLPRNKVQRCFSRPGLFTPASRRLRANAAIQRVRGVISAQVRTSDRALIVIFCSSFIVCASRCDRKYSRPGIRIEPVIVGKSTLSTSIHSCFGLNGRAAVSCAIWFISVREQCPSSIVFGVAIGIKNRHTMSHTYQLLLHRSPMNFANIFSIASEINDGSPVCDSNCCPRDHCDYCCSHKKR